MDRFSNSCRDGMPSARGEPLAAALATRQICQHSWIEITLRLARNEAYWVRIDSIEDLFKAITQPNVPLPSELVSRVVAAIDRARNDDLHYLVRRYAQFRLDCLSSQA